MGPPDGAHGDGGVTGIDIVQANSASPAAQQHPSSEFLNRVVRSARQVEHTVTEEVTGIDIVQAQIRIAGGAPLSALGLGSQADVPAPLGYALQCRITCEDPDRNFQV